MADSMTQLFTSALGLQVPWRVEQVRFEPQASEIHFDVVCEAQWLPCPRCGADDQPVHDRQRRDWQHLHFFQYRALVNAAVPRCRGCAAVPAVSVATPKSSKCRGRASAAGSRCCSRRWW